MIQGQPAEEGCDDGRKKNILNIYMLGISFVSFSYILYAYSGSTKSQDLIRHTMKGTGITHFYLNIYCWVFFQVGSDSNR